MVYRATLEYESLQTFRVLTATPEIEPLEVTSDYWQAKHRRLDERLKSQ